MTSRARRSGEHRANGWLRAGLGMLVAVACTTPTEPRFPRDAVPLDPQPQFALWWRMTEACSGLRGALGAVRWYVQPGVEALHVAGEADGPYSGYWWADGNRILLTEKAVTDGWLVRHEMLHALIGRAGHPRTEFVERCGGIVTCSGECRRQAGADAHAPADAIEIDAAELDVSVAVVPSTSFRLRDNGGWFAYVVTATNPRPEAVWVRIHRRRPDAGGAATFGFVEGPNVWSYAWTTEPRVAFGPWQTKQYTYDRAAITRAGYAYKAGAYEVRGFFNSDTTPPVAFTILP